ncbi:MAG: hypothetical protein Q8P67_20820 [archaeon]|nr:hypothetical protein [archaeon]
MLCSETKAVDVAPFIAVASSLLLICKIVLLPTNGSILLVINASST